MDLLALDRAALAVTDRVVAAVRPEHLDGPTPCGDWTVRELLEHMAAHNHGFAAGARGFPVGGEVWDGLTIDDDDVCAAYAASAAAVTSAFEAAGLPDLIEVYGYGALPAPVAMRMHIVDFVVHGWDVARSIGVDPGIDEDLAASTLTIMRGFPGTRPNKAFGIIVDVPPSAPTVDRLMGFVGRDPAWHPSR